MSLRRNVDIKLAPERRRRRGSAAPVEEKKYRPWVEHINIYVKVSDGKYYNTHLLRKYGDDGG